MFDYKGRSVLKSFGRFLPLLVISPILFVGCVSDKNSLIQPKITKTKVTTLENNQSLSPKDDIKDDIFASAIFVGNIPLDEMLIDQSSSNTSNPNTSNEIFVTSTEPLTMTTLQANETWEEFSKEDEVLETAQQFLGVKYIWAANGPWAFDCSGFTKYVFAKIGISLPRYSGHQANIGEKIKFSELQKGDLVFFDTTKKFKGKVNHVGIFMGNNEFIHASSGGKKVMITSFDDKKFYKKKFLYARRIIDTNDNVALMKYAH